MIHLAKRLLPDPIKKMARGLRSRMVSPHARYYCPVCSKRVGGFEPLPEFYVNKAKEFGFPYTSLQSETCNSEGYLCPWCGASDRDRLCTLYIRDCLWPDWQDDQKCLLDIAPSRPLSQFITHLISVSRAEVVYRTADLFMDGVDDSIDVMDMHIYADDQFDFFICSHVLEHVVDDRKALSELYRILKPMGQGILMTPIALGVEEINEDPSITDEAERWRRFGQGDHVRLYSKPGFIDRISEAGFRIHQYGWEYFGEEVFTRNGITKQSVLYVVEK
jgi:SAM-dependent methyltransferase